MKRVFYFCMTLTLALSVVLASCPFKASASAISVPFDLPYVFPTSSWSADDVVKEYGDLSEEQKRALYYLVGSNATLYGVNRGLTVEGITDAVSWILGLGERINTSIMSLPYQALDANSPLRRNLSNLIDYVSNAVTDTFDSWYNAVVKLGHLGHVYTSEYAQGWTDLVGSSDLSAIDSWQTTVTPFEYQPNYFIPFDSAFSVVQYQAISNYYRPFYFSCYRGGFYYCFCFPSDAFDVPFALFLDLDINQVYFVNRDFSRFDYADTPSEGVVSSGYGSISSYSFDVSDYVVSFLGSNSFSGNDYVTIAESFLDSSVHIYNRSASYYNFWTSIAVPVYVGTSSHKELLSNVTSFDIIMPSLSRTVIYNPSVPVAIDALDVEKVITGDFVADSAREFVESVALSLEDAQTTTWNRDAVAVTITNPLADGSGISISPTFFSGFTSYIQYLWSFAEPLVLYTRDLLTCFTFDGQGLSWIFFGVCSLGVIGGVVYKFLQ